MKKLIRVLLFMVAICFAVSPGQAMAQGITQYNPHPYIGVGLGAFGLKASAPGYSQSNTEFGGFVNAGVSFNDYLAVELRLGTTTKGSKSFPAGTLGSPAPFTMDIQPDYALSYLAKLQYPASPQFNVYALLGATTAKGKMTASIAGVGSGSISKTKTGFTWGVGGDYNVNNQVTAGVEFVQYWNDVTVDSASNTKFSFWGVTANAAYHF